jgi:hypothetical protein
MGRKLEQGVTWGSLDKHPSGAGSKCGLDGLKDAGALLGLGLDAVDDQLDPRWRIRGHRGGFVEAVGGAVDAYPSEALLMDLIEQSPRVGCVAYWREDGEPRAGWQLAELRGDLLG